MDRDHDRVILIGEGRLGRTILRSLGKRVVAIVRKSVPRDLEARTTGDEVIRIEMAGLHSVVEAETMWLAVPDRVIPEVVDKLVEIGIPAALSLVVHSSGALGVEVLNPLESNSCKVAALHPNLVLDGNSPFPADTIWGITQRSLSIDRVRRLLGVDSHRFLPIGNRHRPIYHAAATLVANYPLLLAEHAAGLYRTTGVDALDARAIIAGYLRSVAEKVESANTDLSLLDALTGPVARGDAETLDLQLESIEEEGMELTEELLRFLIEITKRSLERS